MPSCPAARSRLSLPAQQQTLTHSPTHTQASEAPGSVWGAGDQNTRTHDTPAVVVSMASVTCTRPAPHPVSQPTRPARSLARSLLSCSRSLATCTAAQAPRRPAHDSAARRVLYSSHRKQYGGAAHTHSRRPRLGSNPGRPQGDARHSHHDALVALFVHAQDLSCMHAIEHGILAPQTRTNRSPPHAAPGHVSVPRLTPIKSCFAHTKSTPTAVRGAAPTGQWPMAACACRIGPCSPLMLLSCPCT